MTPQEATTLSHKIQKAISRLNSGRGMTGKPLSAKHQDIIRRAINGMEQRLTEHRDEQIAKALLQAFSPVDYDSLKVGDTLGIFCGDFCLTSKPNLYQHIEDRWWIFEQTTDDSGEPFMNGGMIVRIPGF